MQMSKFSYIVHLQPAVFSTTVLLPKEICWFCVLILFELTKMEITLLRYRTFSSKKFYAKMLYLRWSFNNSSSSVPSRVFAALEGKSFSCCCCTALNTIVYRTVSISDISLPRLKIKMKNGFQCLGELLSVFGIWSKLESSKHNISKIQK